MTYIVRMTNEPDVGRYMVELFNIDANECECTEYFPYDTGIGGDGDRGKAFALAKACQIALADEYEADRQHR